MTTTKLTGPQIAALEAYKDGKRDSGLRLGISGNVVQTLYSRGFLKSCNWSKKWIEIDFRITEFGLDALETTKKK